jgi:hypothetical protein
MKVQILKVVVVVVLAMRIATNQTILPTSLIAPHSPPVLGRECILNLLEMVCVMTPCRDVTIHPYASLMVAIVVRTRAIIPVLVLVVAVVVLVAAIQVVVETRMSMASVAWRDMPVEIPSQPNVNQSWQVCTRDFVKQILMQHHRRGVVEKQRMKR